MSNGKLYYQVRGGNYTNTSGGTTCQFNFDIAQPTGYNVDIGFRCGSDNPP